MVTASIRINVDCENRWPSWQLHWAKGARHCNSTHNVIKHRLVLAQKVWQRKNKLQRSHGIAFGRAWLVVGEKQKTILLSWLVECSPKNPWSFLIEVIRLKMILNAKLMGATCTIEKDNNERSKGYVWTAAGAAGAAGAAADVNTRFYNANSQKEEAHKVPAKICLYASAQYGRCVDEGSVPGCYRCAVSSWLCRRGLCCAPEHDGKSEGAGCGHSTVT